MPTRARRLVAAMGMVACCGLSMAVAVGVVAVTSSLALISVAVAAAVACVVLMTLMGHRHLHHDGSRPAVGSHDSV